MTTIFIVFLPVVLFGPCPPSSVTWWGDCNAYGIRAAAA
jgi:hypothetical protein